MSKEITWKNEEFAHRHRLELIAAGHSVSLVAFDTERNVYAFDDLGTSED